MPNNDYTVNGIILCPTETQWLARRPLDVQGDGRPLYPAPHAFRMTWEYTTFEEWAKIQDAFNQTRTTGSATIEVPGFPTANPQSYGFVEYSGVIVAEPVAEAFFAQHISGAVLVITNIITE